MIKLSTLFAINRASFVFCLISLFCFLQYIRRKKTTLLCFAIGSFIFTVLSITIFLGQKGYNLISLVIIGIICVALSYKELNQLDKEGKTIAHLFDFDKYDYLLAALLCVVWLFIKYTL